MAQKKFSRLSIMLEARDRMSRPMQQAARASQNLQSRVGQLSNALDRSRSSVVNASVSNRILAERYRELSNRISANNEKVKLSTRLFRALPAPIRLAAYMMEGYAKAAWRAATQNMLVKTSTKIVTLAFKTLSTVTWNLSYYLGKAAKKMYEFTRLNKVVKALVHPFKMVGQEVKKFNGYVLQSIKNTFAYKATSAVIKMVAKDIKVAALAQKTFIKDIPHLMKGTRAWQAYAYATQKTKMKIVEARLAFELFKNSSRGAERISRVIDSIGNAAKKTLIPFKQLINNFRQLKNVTQSTGGRGRATFNQLADANARLNREVSKLNSQLAKSNSHLSKMKTSLGSLNGMGAAFGTAYAAQAAGQTGSQVVQSTVGRAMEQNYSQASVSILAGSENGAKFYKQIQDYAAATAYSAEDWSRNMRGAISKSKSVQDLEKYQTVMEQLATLDPVQGLDGAALAVRELNSGDIVSLVERFELPRSALKKIKDIKDPIEQIEKLSVLVGENTGYTVKNIQKMKELPLMQWQKLTNSAKTMMGYIGAGALEKLAPIFEKVNKAISAGKLDGFIKKMSDGFANITQKAIDFVMNFSSNIENIKAKWQPFLDLIGNIKSSISEAMPTIAAIMDNARTIFNNVATEINAVWPTVNTVFQTALGLVKQFSDWIVNNWNTIVPVVLGVVAALGALKIANGVALAIGVLKGVITLWRNGTLLMTVAQWAMNTALLANPIGLVIALVVGIAVAIYAAYQRSETFRNGVNKLWEVLKGAGMAALDGITGAFKSVTEWIGKAWDKFNGFIDKVKNAKINWGGFLPGGKDFIELGGKEKGHHGGLSNVPYNGYNARLHKGERVLTAVENKAYNSGKGQGGGVTITGNTFHVRQDSDIDAIAEALYKKLSEAQLAMG